MKPTQTATLKSIGGASQPLHDLGEQEHEERAAGQRLGHGEHHQRGVGQVVVGQVQDDEDQHDHGREDEPQRLRRPHLVLELAAPLDVDALGQLHLLGDDALGLVDEADDVAAADVERHVVQQPAVLALDHRRAFDDADVGQRAQRESAACRAPACGGAAAWALA